MHIQRVQRFQLAMARCPSARLLELGALAMLASPPKGYLLDMMAGEGFVSRLLGPAYELVHALDNVSGSSGQSRSFQQPIQCDAADPDIEVIIGRTYDTIISLAGFHHILPAETSQGNIEAVFEYRVKCLAGWRKLLNRKGRLILADVPAMGEPLHGKFSLTDPALSSFPELAMQLTALPGSFQKLPERPLPEPACFFNAFVTQESITPHHAFFESRTRLSHLLENAGFTKLRTAVLFTPWHFVDQVEAAWFIHHLFGIGTDGYDSPGEMPTTLTRNILHEVEAHLGLWPTGQGCWVGWKLLYIVAENPT